jgi:hypothetical protein
VIKLTYPSQTPSHHGIAGLIGDANCEATMSSLATLMFALHMAAQVLAVIFLRKWNMDEQTFQPKIPQLETTRLPWRAQNKMPSHIHAAAGLKDSW